MIQFKMRFREVMTTTFVFLSLSASVLAVTAVESKPLIRDIQSGYLLNCSFRAIRPYPWKKLPLLTGWETDDRGGTWESSPKGFLGGNQFAFHVEWFRLDDTSVEHAVTIRHQIARQETGRVTLEYRFRLPKIMDGVTWQLRDMKQPAVSIVTQAGNLCYQSADGSLKILQGYKVNTDYGVRVDADLNRKTANIFINGQVRASNVPFLNNVRTIDYVLVKTAEQSTGKLYLNPVNVYKGYNLCETFVSSMDGALPVDWKAGNSGKAIAATIKSSAAPDTLSLKLTGGSAARNFELGQNKVVFEFCFMTPVRAETLTELGSTSGSIISIATHNDDLCIIGPDGKFATVVKDYRANFWYAIKAIVDTGNGRAEIYVNHKKVMESASCIKGLPASAVSFAVKDSDKVLWVDDITIYPWRDYPADYVPQPKPVTEKNDILVGVHSCSLWKEGDAYAGWEYVYPYAKQRKPYLGWYDEGNPEVADWEIKWQAEHGIDFEQYCWYRPNDAVNQPIKRGVLEQGIRQGLFNARYSGLKKFTIMYTNQGAGRTNHQDWKNHLIPYWIEYFFKDPRYLKVDGKPVLAIYSYKLFLADFGGSQGAARAISTLRKACEHAGLPGIIVLMADRYGPKSTLQQMKSIGVDYIFAYHWCTGNIDKQMKKMDTQRRTGAKVGLGVVPCFSNGWHTEPWGWAPAGWGDDGIWATVKEYKKLAKWTKDEYLPKMPADSLGSKMVFSANWNEFGEGHFIMPSTLAGFGYVDVIREVFGGGGAHEDIVPTDKQKKRFTALYPKD